MTTLQQLDFRINYKGRDYNVIATPQLKSEKNGLPLKFKITLEHNSMGTLIYKANKWESNNIIDQELIDIIGSHLKDNGQ
jgi:hypothetical protein